MTRLSLIEWMIIAAIVGILAAITVPAFKQHRERQAHPNGQPHDYTRKVSTPNGTVIATCLNGFMYSVDRNGNAFQQVNTLGNGIACRG